VHLNLYTGEQERHAERLAEPGAIRVADWPYPAGAAFIVMRDPDGNEFCVIDRPELLGRDPAKTWQSVPRSLPLTTWRAFPAWHQLRVSWPFDLWTQQRY
jgi:Glyoxalase-like domain